MKRTLPEPPNGFKRYPSLMLPDGSLVEPASCWLLDIHTFEERDVQEAVGEGTWTLSRVAERIGNGQDLMPVIRRGLAAMEDGKPVERDVYYVIQRRWNMRWVDSSNKYYKQDIGDGKDHAYDAVTTACSGMREVFGEDEVRVVTRITITTESVLED